MKKIALVLLVLLFLLTTSYRIERVGRTLTQQVYTYYFPIAGRNAQLPPAPKAPAASQKRGVGLTHGLCADQFGSWGYDWSPNPPACAIETVPMAWGSVPAAVGGSSPASGNGSKDAGGSSNYLLGFNEPDQPDQSDLSPAKAAALWPQLETRFADRRLIAPAPSDRHPEWLVQFRDAYIIQHARAPRLDGLAVHCYLWTAADCEAVVQKYAAWARAWGIGEIWVTEFAFATGNQRTPEQAWSEASAFIQWMDRDPLITRYAWFAARVSGTEPWSPPAGYVESLLDANGNLTFWGLRYK